MGECPSTGPEKDRSEGRRLCVKGEMANPTITVNRRAPDFSLMQTRGAGSKPQLCSLADYQDRWLMLLFYPRDFTLVCPTELSSVSARIAEFEERECDVLAISTDSIATHERWL